MMKSDDTIELCKVGDTLYHLRKARYYTCNSGEDRTLPTLCICNERQLQTTFF